MGVQVRELQRATGATINIPDEQHPTTSGAAESASEQQSLTNGPSREAAAAHESDAGDKDAQAATSLVASMSVSSTAATSVSDGASEPTSAVRITGTFQASQASELYLHHVDDSHGYVCYSHYAGSAESFAPARTAVCASAAEECDESWQSTDTDVTTGAFDAIDNTANRQWVIEITTE